MTRKDTFSSVAAAWRHKRREPLAFGLMAAGVGAGVGLAGFTFHGLSGAVLMVALVTFAFLMGRRQTRGTAPPDQQLVPTDPLNGPAQVGSGTLADGTSLLIRDDVERLRLIAKQDALMGLSNRSYFKQVVDH